ncbi:MAG: hypothetical protein ACPG7F_19505, partial [Aggregatilineales bacterium]
MLKNLLLSFSLLFINVVAIQAQDDCQPIIENIQFDGTSDSSISQRLAELYRADQAGRDPDTEVDFGQLIEEDR